MSDLTDLGASIAQRKGAELMGISVSTVARLLNEGVLAFIRPRRQRQLYTSQVEYIAAARRAGRTGSVAEWAAEWNAARQQIQAA